MVRQLFVGLVTEGDTDRRFLESVLRKTFESIAFECPGEIEIEVNTIKITKSKFAQDVVTASKVGVERYGIMVLCVHADADSQDDYLAFRDRIEPAQRLVMESPDDTLCKIIIAVVPVYMTESWLLVDRELLKREIGTTLTDVELGIHRDPESIADPKQIISDAIRIARGNIVRRRRSDLTISDLYLPMGQKVSMDKLEALASYLKFQEAVRNAFRQLNYLH